MALLTPVLRAWAAGLFLAAAAQAEIPREYQIKAAFLYNFPQFVNWPDSAFADARAPLVIGVVGNDPFDGFLDNLVKSALVNAHPIQVRRCSRWEEATACQVVYLSAAKPEAMRAMLRGLGGKPILTVGDTPAFLSEGGMIRLVDENNKMRLRINLAAAKAAKLAISSKLLRRAEIAPPGAD